MHLRTASLISLAFAFALRTATAQSSITVLPEYQYLYNRCKAAGNSTYVSVLYAGSTGVVDYAFGDCYPYEMANGDVAQQAVFCRAATCNNNPNRDCTGGAIPPAPVPVLDGLTLVNAGNFVQLIGQGARCWDNPLSGI